MIKSVFLFCIIFFQSFTLKAQGTLYDYIKLGDFQVGFMDTILFDTDYRYEAYDYNGMKPIFIQIWHPIIETTKGQSVLKFSDFFETEYNEDLANVQKQLKKHLQESFIRDCIEENLISGEANNYGNHSYDDILRLSGEIETISSYEEVPEFSQFPVIIYHHGAQSYSFENFAMAEYFASRGFIFMSANFHLPYENTIFGLKPYSKIIKDEDEQSLRNIVRFAQSLSNSTSVFFIGHSLGAQMGLRTFDQDTFIKGLISLETTIEFKTDHEKIKEMWPEVFQKVITDHVVYPFPVLFCAATGQDKPFDFFYNINAPQITFAPTKEEFEHNAYTSVFYMRFFLDNNVVQTDKEIFNSRLQLYVRHLELMSGFIKGILKNEEKSGKETMFIK
ncbi:MAG: alpha/beta hydrolase family protein [Lentimicrobium sp.]